MDEGAPGVLTAAPMDFSTDLATGLGQVADWMQAPHFNLWARELADTAHRAFVYGPVADFAGMIERRDLATADPLGLGGVLLDVYRLEQLARRGAPPRREPLNQLLDRIFVV